MKKRSLVIVIVALIGISLALSTPSQARGFRGGWGWWGAGAFAGGILLGTAIARPRYYAPAPVYVYPQPTVVYAAPQPVYVPNQAYAYPDSAAASGTGGALGPGQWVEVPGQYVSGRWVAPHRVWVPDHP
ncbi:MAG TPA: hypothetical protein VMT62_12970 [Syntrophorhabdaceae bacterium]|nr:hypothetical protein [Syntrophorhabdaceae bacterium]